MTKITKIVVNKKNPKGVVNFFGNVQNKVGTYSKDRLDSFKRKLVEKSIELGEIFLIAMDRVDDVTIGVADVLFDKIIDRYENHNKKEDLIIDKNLGKYSDEVLEYKPVPEIIPTRRVNFEDLEPLGKMIDEEDDISELQGLKMELLFGERVDEFSKESGGIRKK